MRRTSPLPWAIVLLALISTTAWSTDSAVLPAGQGNAQLLELARKGQFEQLLGMVKEAAPEQHPPAAGKLVSDLERYQFHRAHRSQQREQVYAAAMDQMVQLHEAGKLEQALTKAIEAQNHAARPQQLQHHPHVEKLIQQAEQAADQAADHHDWLTALILYRDLGQLFEPQPRYRQQVQQAQHHLRLMRLYAPNRLARLHRMRAEQQGEPAEPMQLENDTWESRLQGVRLSMLYDTLNGAAEHHVDNIGHSSLTVGALQSVLTFVQFQAVRDAFAPLGQADRVAKFVEQVQTELQRVQRRGNALTRLEAMSAIDRVLQINRRTLELPEQVIIYELTEGVMASLDEFSEVIWPQHMGRFSRSTQGRFSGVGIQIGRTDGQLTVISPLEGTPAHAAGLRPNDVIMRVDDRDTHGWSLEEAVDHITGPEGTAVMLTIQRQGHDDPLVYRLTRKQIAIESIKGWRHKPGGGWDYYIDRQARIGYIRLTQFIPQTPDDLDAAINQMQQDQGIEALVLDLRFNTGGLLRKAVDVADRFVTEGPIVSTVGSSGMATSRFSAKPRYTHPQFPLVVLINQGSASASEIVAGALQDYERAVIVGQRSFGKGSVQDLYPIDGSRALLKLTTQYYRLPGRDGQPGRIVHRRPQDTTWGIEPDLVVRMTDQEMDEAMTFRRDADVLREFNQPAADVAQLLTRGLDPQLEAALLYLRTELIAKDLKMVVQQ